MFRRWAPARTMLNPEGSPDANHELRIGDPSKPSPNAFNRSESWVDSRRNVATAASYQGSVVRKLWHLIGMRGSKAGEEGLENYLLLSNRGQGRFAALGIGSVALQSVSSARPEGAMLVSASHKQTAAL